MPKPCQVQNGFTQSLARDRSTVNANTANHFIAVHDGHALAEFRGGDCALLSGAPTPYDDQVISNRLH
jgi:hypothetical protein